MPYDGGYAVKEVTHINRNANSHRRDKSVLDRIGCQIGTILKKDNKTAKEGKIKHIIQFHDVHFERLSQTIA